MPDQLVVVLLAATASGVVCLLGVLCLRLLQGRSVTVHVTVLLSMTVLSVVGAVVAVGQAMFISEHDLGVLLIVLAVSGVVSSVIALWAGRRLARSSVWAAEAQARERRLENSRRQLVAWVSHDLRTPLAGIRAMAEALEDGVVADPAEVSDYHRRITQEADRMSALVDDLFELSRIHAGRLEISLHAVSLADVVSDAVATVGPVARAKGVRLVAQDGGYGLVQGIEPELGRVIGNLLLNAVRHTPADGVVTVHGGAEARTGWVAVTDGCGGIPEDDLPHVFDVAFRGEAARSPSQDGNGAVSSGGGLGLAIVRGLVDIHDGDVTVVNDSKGCRFTVRLPVAVG